MLFNPLKYTSDANKECPLECQTNTKRLLYDNKPLLRGRTANSIVYLKHQLDLEHVVHCEAKHQQTFRITF